MGVFDFSGKTIGSIEAISSQRISQEQDMGYIGFHITAPIMQLTAGELVSIIFADNTWPFFKEFFQGKKEIMRSKFMEILEVRNALAHFRPIKKDDIQAIKQNINHLFGPVEEFLKAMTSIEASVPTNCVKYWYTRSKEIESSRCKISSYFSKNEDCVKIILTYTSPILSRRKAPNQLWYWPMTINTSSVLNDYRELSEFCIYITESSSSQISDDEIPKAFKCINFIFSTDSIEKAERFFSTLQDAVSIIDDETEQILKENTAQGKYVRSVNCSAELKNKYWHTNDSAMRSEVKKDDVVEYWGDIWLWGNVITEISKYPWMPVPIAEDEFFF